MNTLPLIIVIIFTVILASFVIYQYLSFKKRKNHFSGDGIYPYIPAKLATLESHVLELINKYRLENGITKMLKADSFATELSKLRCHEMISENELSHLQWVDEADALIQLGSDIVGENIGYGYNSPDSVFNAWVKSEGHRKNMLNDKWDYIGIGIVKSSSNRYWYCTLFITI